MSLFGAIAMLVPAIRRLKTSRDNLRSALETSVAVRDALVTERNGLIAERDRVVAERDRLVAERDGLIAPEEVSLNADETTMYTALCGNRYENLKTRTDIRCFESEGLFARPAYEARRYKLLGHLYFPECKHLIWVDANVRLKINPEEAVDKYLAGADVAIFKHPARNCMFEEFKALRNEERFASDVWLQAKLRDQEASYRARGFPENFGLWEDGFIIRKNTPRVNSFFEAWWAELCRWQFRDQVSLPFVLRQFEDEIRFRTIVAEDIRTNPDFEWLC